MPPEGDLPGLTDSIAAYLDAWETFGEESFDAEELARRGDRTTETDLEGRLDAAVAYGLLGLDEEGRYRVRCSPDERVEDWQRAARSRMALLHRRVQEATGGGRDESAGAGDVLEYRGDRYLPVRLGPDPGVEESLDALVALLEGGDDVAGVAVLAPGEAAGEIQVVADRLCDDDAMAARSAPYRFEKENSEVVYGPDGDLEYRLYLLAEAA